jgi:TM2 domain-containing membrane protein YozV
VTYDPGNPDMYRPASAQDETRPMGSPDPTVPLGPPQDPYAQPPYATQPDPTRPFPAPPVAGPPTPVPPHIASPYPTHPSPAQPYSAQPYPAQPYSGQPYSPEPAAALVPTFPYHPPSTQQLSDKSKITAGLLQLVLGFLFALGGVGRLYAGQTALGVVQLAASVVAWSMFWCGFLLFIPFAGYIAIWLWFVIDGIVLLAGRPVDGQGRLLRS